VGLESKLRGANQKVEHISLKASPVHVYLTYRVQSVFLSAVLHSTCSLEAAREEKKAMQRHITRATFAIGCVNSRISATLSSPLKDSVRCLSSPFLHAATGRNRCSGLETLECTHLSPFTTSRPIWTSLRWNNLQHPQWPLSTVQTMRHRRAGTRKR
jgi:hypothetical protein